MEIEKYCSWKGSEVATMAIGSFNTQAEGGFLCHFSRFSGDSGRCLSLVPGSAGKIRKRCSFSHSQVSTLEKEFRMHRYLSSEQRTKLAGVLNLTEQQVLYST